MKQNKQNKTSSVSGPGWKRRSWHASAWGEFLYSSLERIHLQVQYVWRQLWNAIYMYWVKRSNYIYFTACNCCCFFFADGELLASPLSFMAVIAADVKCVCVHARMYAAKVVYKKSYIPYFVCLRVFFFKREKKKWTTSRMTFILFKKFCLCFVQNCNETWLQRVWLNTLQWIQRIWEIWCGSIWCVR